MVRQFPRSAVLAVLLLGLSVLLGGCGTPGRSYAKTGMQETLEINILRNNSKMFVYRLKWPDDAIPNHIRVARHSGPNQPRTVGGVDINRNTYERLQQNAAYVVKHMKYCREGFIELDRSISRYHLWLKGECKESANATDRQQFAERDVLAVNPDI
ncbi:hypothetical protein ACSV5M_06025 [Cellvibrio sp. ARAG 10.3]|uniref:hypothetical protein n=1 Tax=Cellvibrio sp. ARAG 10.3 TaxID=3451358 RepID=UPI003F48E198